MKRTMAHWRTRLIVVGVRPLRALNRPTSFTVFATTRRDQFVVVIEEKNLTKEFKFYFCLLPQVPQNDR